MWLETSLVPTLITGQVIVMDNATFHKGGRIEELIQKAGCRLLYLPAYWEHLIFVKTLLLAPSFFLLPLFSWLMTPDS